MRRALPISALALASALVLASCSSSPEPGNSGSGDDVSDDARVVATVQGDVEIPTNPERVVVLNHALAGYLFDLNVPVTAVTSADFDYDAAFSEFWEDDAEAAGTEFVPWGADGFDTEAILAFDPDLIIAGGIGFPFFVASDSYDDLSTIAPTVIVSNELASWDQQFEFLAVDVFDNPDVYQQAVEAYDARVDEVAAAITPPPAPSAFLSILPDGRTYGQIETMGWPTVLASVGIEPAPIFAEGNFEPYTAGGDGFEMSTEQVAQTVTQPTVFITGFNADIGDVDQVAQNPVFAALPAFQNDSAYVLPYWMARGDYDETLALLDTIEELFG